MNPNFQQELGSLSPFVDFTVQEPTSNESDIDDVNLHEHHHHSDENDADEKNSLSRKFLQESETETDDHNKNEPDHEDFLKDVINKALSFIQNKKDRNFSTFLPSDKNLQATKKNQGLLAKANVPILEIYSVLEKSINLSRIRDELIAYNKANPAKAYAVANVASPVPNSVFTEAIHQFQLDQYINPKEHDGISGSSTFDSLGFFNNGLKGKVNSSGYYGQTQLNRKDVKPEIPLSTKEFTAENWYQHIVKPAWLGVKISDGVHLLLYRKLQEAEKWLLSQPQYKGFTPAQLGKALGFESTTRYSGARLSANKQAMHGFGLALDIHVLGNPWIGAGWIKGHLENTKFVEDLHKAAGEKSDQIKGKNTATYLHSISERSGMDTKACYNELQQRNNEFKAYISQNKTALNFWKSSSTFGVRNPINGFLNLHTDLVFALRQIVGLAWGAIDFGPGASGDIMHFDLRTIGLGRFLCEKIKGFVPKKNHPALKDASKDNEWMVENEIELHEAIEEGEWEDNISHDEQE